MFRFSSVHCLTIRVRRVAAMAISLLAIVGGGFQLAACSVPVFRYGLEHWTADPYRIIVTHRGPLAGDTLALVQRLKEAADVANLAVQTLDISRQTEPEMLEAWKHVGSPDAPWLVVRPPATARVVAPVWSAALSAVNVDALLDSPARKAIASRLGDGQSAVFVLLESGNKGEDDAAAGLLEARLQYLASVLELPRLDEQDIRNGLVTLPPDGLHLEFSVLRVSRTDAAEHAFIQMLLSTEPDLKDVTGPIAFPVFGQGRALYALVGKGIKHETVDEAASFLIGSCSCQVKEQNPGADLLMAVNWKALLKNQAVGLEDLPTAKEIVGGMPETVTIAARAPDSNTTDPVGVAGEGASSRWPVGLGVILLLVCVIAGLRVVASRRGRIKDMAR